MEHWAEIEADFLREYGIDLISELSNLSIRRFKILLNGLSTDSIFVFVQRSEANGTKPIEDPEKGEQAMKASGLW